MIPTENFFCRMKEEKWYGHEIDMQYQ